MRVVAVIAIVMLSACASPPEPVPNARPMTPLEWCANAIRVMGLQGLDPLQKQAVFEMARNRGCFNPQ